MILLIIFALLWIISLVFIVKSNGFDGGTVLMSLTSLCILFLVLTLFNVSIQTIWFNEKNVSFTKNIEPIASLKYNNSGLHGSFFLGSGTIENKRYYYFMKKNNDGSFSESRMVAPNTKIFEDSDSTNQPYIVRTYNYTVTSPTLKMRKSNWVDDNYQFIIYPTKPEFDEDYSGGFDDDIKKIGDELDVDLSFTSDIYGK